MLQDTPNGPERNAVYIPSRIWNSLKKEFNLSDEDVEAFIVKALDKMTAEHSLKTNSEGVAQDEANEIEENLRGLGYL